MAGLTTAGFEVKTLPDIIADVEAQELSLISASLDVQPSALMGVINGIYCQALYELWQLAGELYNGIDPDQATGDQLSSVALITGTVREPATSTIVASCVVNVEAGFHADAGQMFAGVVGNTLNLFYSLDDVDNPAGIPADVVVDFICQDTGPVQALSDTLIVIAQPLSGWNSVTNPDDGHIGSDIETDAALRTRRQLELALGGNSTADAIKADVLQNMQPSAKPPTSVPTISVTVLFNSSDVTDANGVPPHSIEVIARAPGATTDDDQMLADLIFNDKAAGDGTHGTDHKTVTDSQGNENTVYFTRPEDTPLTVAITIVTDAAAYAGGGGEGQIKTNMALFASDFYAPGVEVYIKRLADVAFRTAGVLDWTVCTVNSGGNLPIDIRHVATLDVADITVTVA